jgi:hypothetical protein
MASSFEIPDNVPVTDENGNTPLPWGQWFARVHRFVTASQQSGTTAQRPTKGLWLGRYYFDTTLGFPVWVQSVTPTVWVDATGAAV